MAITTFGSYRTEHTPRLPQREPDNDDELRLLGPDDGVREFEDASCSVEIQHLVPPTGGQNSEKRFLWVIRESDIPFIREYATVEPPLESGRCKHTNLTGGAAAYCGGEVWFASDRWLILNGGSGRYPPKDAKELETVVVSFEQAGYKVWSAGWDEELSRPARVAKWDPPWGTED